MSLSIGAAPYAPDPGKLAGSPHNAINVDARVQNDVKENTAAGVRKKETEGITDCQTCKNRKYQDGSNDPGVSFKAPTKMSPGAAGSAVRSHEQEHVNRNAAKAEREDREVISSSVSIYTAVCPECGRSYVAGGETRTVTANKNDDDKQKQQEDAQRNTGKPRLELKV